MTIDKFGAVVFGAAALSCLISTYLLERNAIRIGSFPLGVFGGFVFMLSLLFGYESLSLFTPLPTLSWLTNREYITYPLAFSAITFLVVYGIGALIGHFTYNKGFHWSMLLLTDIALNAGFVTAVIFHWIPQKGPGILP